jgi:tape measure domain-containing protein
MQNELNAVNGAPAANSFASTFMNRLRGAMAGRFASLRAAWVNDLGLTGSEAGSLIASRLRGAFNSLRSFNFRDTFLGLRAAGLSAVTALGEGFRAIQPMLGRIGQAAGIAGRVISSAWGVAAGAFRVASSALATVSSAMENFGRKVGFASFIVQGLGYQLTFLVTGPLAAAAGAIGFFGTKFALNLEQARAGLAPFVGGLKNAQKEIDILAKIAQKSPAFDTTKLINYARNLLSAGLSQQKVNDLIGASSNLFTTYGLSVDQADRAFYAMIQIMRKGKLYSEELNQQLGEQIPAVKLLADAYGITQAELLAMVKAGKISGTEFVDAMIKIGNTKQYVDGAALGADTLKAKLVSLKEQVQYKLAMAFEKHLFPVLNDLAVKYAPSILKAFDGLNGVLPSVAQWLKETADSAQRLKDRWDDLSPATKDNIKQFGLMLVAAGPTILIFSRIGAAVGAIATVVGLLTTPLGIVVALFGGLGIALYSIKDPLKYYFEGTEAGRETTEKLKNAVSGLKDYFTNTFSPALKSIGTAITDALYGFVTGRKNVSDTADAFAKLRDFLVEIGKAFMESLGPAWESIKSSLKDLGLDLDKASDRAAFFKAVIATVVLTIGLLAAGIASAAGFIIQIVAGLIRVITDIIVGGFNLIVGIGKVFAGLFQGDWKLMAEGVKQLWNGLWQLVIGTIWDSIQTVIRAVKALVMPIVEWFEWLYDVLVGHSIVPDLINAIVKWFLSLPGKVMGAISGMIDNVIGVFQRMASGAISAVTGLASGVANKIGEIRNSIVAKVSGFGNLLVSSGRELVQGLIDGISSRLGALANKAAELARTVAKFLPGSPVKEGPLKVLNNGYAGGQIVKMLAGGINDNLRYATYAGDALGAATIPSGLVSAGVINSSFNSAPISPAEGGGITINQTVNVPTPVQDPKEMADYSTRRLVSALTTKATQ